MASSENLKDAFAGESQANRKYLAFAKKADEEGNAQVAKLFRAAAAAETVHAHNHLNVMGGVRSTKENLQEAVKGESYEFNSMYPGFIEQARKDKNADAERTFIWANAVEKIHGSLFKEAQGTLAKTDYYVCQRCGNTVKGSAPDICPICGAPKNMFLKID